MPAALAIARFRRIPIVYRYTAAGVLFGLLFPVVGLGADAFLFRESPAGVVAMVRANPIHGIVLLAPLVLGSVFAVIGGIQARLCDRMSELEAAHAQISASNVAIQRQNVTLQQARDRAMAAERAKQSFLAVMSHELRTPLNGVLGVAGLLEETELTRDQAEYVGIIQQSGKTLLELIGDILDFSELEGQGRPLSPEPTDVEALALDLLRPLEPVAVNKGIGLDLLVSPDLPSVVLDRRRLRHVLLNLVGNAIKFTSAGSVHVALDWDGRDLTVAVADTGPGIPADAQDRIFDSFVQHGTHGEAMGTGLGLAIAAAAAGQLGGEVTLDSVVGRGSTFTARMPAAVSAPSPCLTGLGGTAVDVVGGSGRRRSALLAILCAAGAVTTAEPHVTLICGDAPHARVSRPLHLAATGTRPAHVPSVPRLSSRHALVEAVQWAAAGPVHSGDTARSA